ncbi:MAG TPA: response regulator [Gemmatimonadales bacterium]|nr:response regulator [Gemmatimonadales bacterium]
MGEATSKILVVDDNDAERYYISRVLSKAGYKVMEAATAAEALRLAADVPDLVTLDVRLPDLNGFEVCRRIKADPTTRDVPVLHISASFTTPDAKAEGLDSGADGYLTHPVDPNELLATIRALLRTRQAEARVRAAAREWTTTFDLIDDAVCLTGPSGEVIRCNAAFAKLMRRPYAELIGVPLPTLLPQLGDTAGSALVSGHTITIGDRHYRVSAAGGPSDEILAARAWVLGDVTERARQQEALRRSEEQLQARLAEIEVVYRSAPVGLCVLDGDLRYLRVNQVLAGMHGRSVEDHLGRTVREVMPALADFLEPRMRDVLQSGQPVLDLEVQAPADARPGDQRVWLETWYPVIGSDGRAVGINIASEDVTEKRRLQAQLVEAQRLEAVGRLAGGVAHEANNQMTVVLGCANFILRHHETPSPVRADLEQIRHAAERTARITAQLLAFGRRQHLRPEIADPEQTVKGLEPILVRTLGDRSRLVVAGSSQGRQVQADVGQLEQVLLNLTLNARDAMPAGGTLTISLSPITVDAPIAGATKDDQIPPGDYLCLSVADTGEGMDSATLQRAFEPFFTTKPPGQGSGLGLSMVYGVVRQSGGHVRAVSARGRGTTIEIYLPCVPAAAAAPAVASVAETSVASGRVLLVEDDLSVRSVVMRELMSRGYDVSEASDGKSALERARATPPIDIVITDLAMPQMDGLELARQLEISHPTLPILFISGHPDDQSMQIVRSGRPFLQKPFTGEELVTRLEELLHGTR